MDETDPGMCQSVGFCSSDVEPSGSPIRELVGFNNKTSNLHTRVYPKVSGLSQ
jgi:hypothetical protein